MELSSGHDRTVALTNSQAVMVACIGLAEDQTTYHPGMGGSHPAHEALPLAEELQTVDGLLRESAFFRPEPLVGCLHPRG